MQTLPSYVLRAVLMLAGFSACGAARADGVDCELGFALSNWLEKSQRGSGVGTLHCSDSETMQVRIKVKGSGITAETRGIYSGHARFSRVRRIHDALGTYVSGGSPSAELEHAHAQALSKDHGTLTLFGREGWDLGITFDSWFETYRHGRAASRCSSPRATTVAPTAPSIARDQTRAGRRSISRRRSSPSTTA